MKLETTDRELSALWGLYHGTRERSDTVNKVPKGALYNLLRDHGALIEKLQGTYRQPIETQP